jgi:replication factor A1
LPYGVTPIQKLELKSEDYMEQGVEEKTLFDLKEVDPYTEKVQTKHISCYYISSYT